MAVSARRVEEFAAYLPAGVTPAGATPAQREAAVKAGLRTRIVADTAAKNAAEFSRRAARRMRGAALTLADHQVILEACGQACFELEQALANARQARAGALAGHAGTALDAAASGLIRPLGALRRKGDPQGRTTGQRPMVAAALHTAGALSALARRLGKAPGADPEVAEALASATRHLAHAVARECSLLHDALEHQGLDREYSNLTCAPGRAAVAYLRRIRMTAAPG